MKIYLSGPITGLEEEEYINLFTTWELRMLQLGYQTINPVELDQDLEWQLERKPTREEYLRHDLKELLTCDEILMLPGWSNSKGAQLERRVASECGIKVTYWEEVV